jgi:hypothetical protein
MKAPCFLAVLCITISLNSYAQTNVGGTIVQDMQWTLAGSPYTLTATFGIPSGVTLTIDPGVTINGNFDLLVKGKIIINGTVAQPVHFGGTRLIFKSTDLSQSTIEWIEFNNAGLQLADESEFNNDNPKNSGLLTVKNCKFLNNGYAKTKGYQSSGTLRLENCTFTNAVVYGFYPRSESIEIVNSTITSCTLVSDSYNYGIIISNSTITSSSFSLGCCGSNFQLTDCTVSGSSFTAFNSYNQLKLTRVVSTDTYIALPTADITIVDCQIKAGSIPVGTLISMSSGSITGSTLEGNSSLTLVQTQGNTTIERVSFKNFNVGLEVQNFTTISIKQNNFLGGVTYNLKNLTSKNIDARENYWGTTNDLVIQTKILDLFDNINYGIVDYSGFKMMPVVTNPLPVPTALFSGKRNDGTLLKWSAASNANVAGYKVYHKVADMYIFVGDAGNSKSFVVADSIKGDFAVTGYSAAANGVDDQLEGFESDYSLLSTPFMVIPDNNGSQCAGTSLQVSVTKNYTFGSTAKFYLIESFKSDFSKIDTVAIASTASMLAWTLPDTATKATKIYYRIASDDENVYSNSTSVEITPRPKVSFIIGPQGCAGVLITPNGISSAMVVGWTVDGATISGSTADGFNAAWSTSGTKAIILKASQNNCETTISKTVDFLVPEALSVPTVCSVDFDAASNHIKLSWQYTNTRLAKFKIYRETSQSNKYELIATVSSANQSYVDILTNPQTRAYRYKLSAIDICDHETETSQAVNSVHLQLSQGVDGNWNLSWGQRSDQGIVEIYKKVNSVWGKIAELASVNTTYTDFDKSIQPSFYQVKFTTGNTCGAVSNDVFNGIMSVDENPLAIQVYPNPVTNEMIFSSDDVGEFSLLNSSGGIVHHGNVVNGENRLDVTELTAGLYILNVRLVNRRFATKIIKSNP